MSYQGTNPTTESTSYKDIGAATSATIPTGFQAIIVRNSRFYFKNAAGLEQPIAGTLFNLRGDKPSTVWSQLLWPMNKYPNSANVMSVASDGYNYVLVSFFQGCSRSTDGQRWTSIGNPIASPQGVAGIAGKILMCSTSQVVQSTDGGVTWSSPATMPFQQTPKIKNLNGVWFTYGESGVHRSVDGVNWTNVANGKPPLFDMDFGNGVYTAVGGVDNSITFIMTSPDGITWTNRTATGTGRILRSVIYGMSGGRWLAMGDNGTGQFSTDNGVTWTLSSGVGNTNPYYLLYSIGNIVYAVDKYGTIRQTSDGNSFSSANSVYGPVFSTNEITYAGRMLDRNWISDSNSAAGQNLYLSPVGPGYSSSADRFTGIGGFGTGEVAGYCSGTAGTSFDLSMILAQNGHLLRCLAEKKYVDQVMNSNNYSNSLLFTQSNSSSVVLGSFVNIIGQSLGVGLYRVQGTVVYEMVTTTPATNISFYAALGQSTWVTGTTGASFRNGENMTEVPFSVASSSFPARISVSTPVIYVYSNASNVLTIRLPNGDAVTTTAVLSIVSRIDGTGGVLTSCTRRGFISVQKI